MATTLNPNIYNGGAVVLNSQPYLQFAAQQIAHKQAKDEALENYFRDQNKSINPAGMRSQDISGLTDKASAAQQFFNQNKPAILNPKLDGGKSYSEYQSRHQDQMDYIAQSKSEADKSKQLAAARLDPAKADRFTDDTIQNMELHDLPLTDQRHKSFDLSSLTFNPAPFDAKAREAYEKSLTLGFTPSEKVVGTQNLPNYQIKTTTSKQFEPADLQAIGSRASAFYNSDKSIKHYADHQLLPTTLSDPNQYNVINDAFKGVYGRDAHTPEELFVGESLSNANKKATTEKVTNDEYGKSVALENLRFGHEKDLIGERKKYDELGQNGTNLWVDKYIQSLNDNASSAPMGKYYYDGKTKYEREIPVDPTLSSSLQKGGVTPIHIRKMDDGRFRIIYPLRDKSGNPIKLSTGPNAGDYAVDDSLSVPITEDQLGVALGKKNVTGKARPQEILNVMKNAKTAPATTKPASKKNDPLGIF